MKKIYLILPILILTGGVLMSAGQTKTPNVKYYSAFDIQYAFCSIKTNGLIGLDNRESAIGRRGFGTSSTPAMAAMENGENEISIEISALNWFNPEITDSRKKAEFNPEAYCNVEFIEMTGDDYKITDTISASIDKKGLPVAAEKDVMMKKIIEKEVNPGFIPEKFFNPSSFPKGMPLYEFKKKVVVSGLPEWAWTKAEEYKDTPEQRAKLQQAYQAFWEDFNNKNINGVKVKLKIAMEAWAYVTDTTADDYFRDFEFDKEMSESNFKMTPINWEGYEALIMNKGRFIRLVNKSAPDFSPIMMQVKDEIRTVAPTFSLINGEFVIVL